MSRLSLNFYCKRAEKALTQGAVGAIITPVICEGAGIGRQARLRCVCLMAWGFKSPPSHQKAGSRIFPRPCFFAREMALNNLSLRAVAQTIGFDRLLTNGGVPSAQRSKPGFKSLKNER